MKSCVGGVDTIAAPIYYILPLWFESIVKKGGTILFLFKKRCLQRSLISLASLFWGSLHINSVSTVF